jgi:hypothetical protein
MAQGYTNDYSATVNSSYTSGGTSLVITGAVGSLPTSGLNFILKVDSEYMLCTSYSGSTLTVVGAQGGSSAANHSVGATVTACWILPSVLDGIRSDQSQIGTYANIPASGMKMGDRYRCTDSPYELVFDGSNWQYFIGGLTGEMQPPSLLGSWSWVNQGSSTIVTTPGYFNLSVPGSASITSSAYVRTVSVPYTSIIMGFQTNWGLNTAGDYYAGLALRDSGTGKLVFYGVTTSANKLAIIAMNSATSFSGNKLGETATNYQGPWWFFKVTNDSTNRKYYVSQDNRTYEQVYTEASGTFLTENQAGIFGLTQNTTTYTSNMDVFYWTD